jgi:hypothetical protein
MLVLAYRAADALMWTGVEDPGMSWIGTGTRLRVRPTSNSHYGMIRNSVLRAATKPWEACTSG